MLQSTVDAVYAVDAAGRVVLANQAALSILEYDSEEELLGRGSHATIHYRHPGRPTRTRPRCSSYDQERSRVTEDGERSKEHV